MKETYYYCYYIITIIYVFTWISLLSTTSFALHEGQVLAFQPSLDLKQDIERLVRINEKEKVNRGLRTLGSRPPNCEHQCGSCKPCIAVQVPENTSTLRHMRLQYANYEPEGWKCKCATSSSYLTP